MLIYEVSISYPNTASGSIITTKPIITPMVAKSVLSAPTRLIKHQNLMSFCDYDYRKFADDFAITLIYDLFLTQTSEEKLFQEKTAT